MAEYTKGEWKVNLVTCREFGKEITHYLIVGGDDSPMKNRTIADIGCWVDRVNPMADACLISAAPDMYEALKRIQTWLMEKGEIKDDSIWNIQFIKANNATVKALAKAEGKEV